VSSGGATPAISLASGYGDTLNPYASKTANFVLAAPNGSAGAPTFRAIVAADIPTLNQNTSGTAAGLSATLVATSGGTGQSSYAVGDLLYASTTTALSKLADVATGNALISGGVGVAPSYGKIALTTHISGTLPTANGGTNLTSFTANGVVYASSTSALATGSALVFDGSNLGVGVTPSYRLDVARSGSGVSARFSQGSFFSYIFSSSAASYFSADTIANTSYGVTASTLQMSAGNGGDQLVVSQTSVKPNVLLDISGASAGQIKFRATQNASADANTLDDYEEGTWTPGISFGNGTTGITYHADNGGRYTRVGSLVTLTGYLRLANKGSSTGTARITGLPFMPTGTGETGNFANAMGYTVAITYSGTLAFYASSGATSLFAISNSSGATSTILTDTAFANTSQTVISLSYLAT
jgi:hypothetical protein